MIRKLHQADRRVNTYLVEFRFEVLHLLLIIIALVLPGH